MASSRFGLVASLFHSIAFVFSAFASALASIGAKVVEIVEVAFPAPAPVLLGGLATAPRVTGLHQSRSFRRRIAARCFDDRARAPLSAAFIGA